LTPHRIRRVESLDSRSHSQVERAFATPRQQKCDDGDEEKFDCDKRARRFELIRSPSKSDGSSHCPLRSIAVSQARRGARVRSLPVIEDAQKIWAEQELAYVSSSAARTDRALIRSRWNAAIRWARAFSSISDQAQERAR
jgi:hypothetical protein